MIWKGKNTTVLFTDTIFYVEKVKNWGGGTLGISNYNKVAKYKINVQKSIAFLYSSNEQLEFKIKNKIPLTLISPTPK